MFASLVKTSCFLASLLTLIIFPPGNCSWCNIYCIRILGTWWKHSSFKQTYWNRKWFDEKGRVKEIRKILLSCLHRRRSRCWYWIGCYCRAKQFVAWQKIYYSIKNLVNNNYRQQTNWELCVPLLSCMYKIDYWSMYSIVQLITWDMAK